MKRVSLFCGHYGSGKTNIAVNYALLLKKKYDDVTVADLDIVNPYFRTKDSEQLLKESGIKLIALPFANSNVDLPSIPSEIYGLVETNTTHAVIDVGGDERGALALGRFTPYILKENDYDMFFVVNFLRPLTKTAEEAFDVLKEIEAASGIKFTSIINNTNLAEDTTEKTVKDSFKEAEKLADISGLPIAFTAVKKDIAKTLTEKNILPLTLQEKYF